MNELKVDPKLVADQLGHSLDVNQNVYTMPNIARGCEPVGSGDLQSLVMYFDIHHFWKGRNLILRAGDGDRTRDVQLGKSALTNRINYLASMALI